MAQEQTTDNKMFGIVWASLPTELKIEILKCLPLDRLRRLCKLVKDEDLRAQARFALKDKVNDLFREHHLGPSQTWNTMRTTNTILSGSSVVQVIDGSDWIVGDLDFYTPIDEYKRVLAWLKWWGYQIVRSYAPRGDAKSWLDEEYGANNCIEGVYVLEHEEYGIMINVIRSRTDSPFAPIAFFHSTLVMNFISTRGVVCGYPALTLQKIGLLNGSTQPMLRPWTPSLLQALAKYQERGYRFVQGQDNNPAYAADDPEAYRRWTDIHAMRMSFEKDGRIRIKPPTCWRLGFREYRRTWFHDYSPSAKIRDPDGEWSEEWVNWSPPERSRMRG